MTREASFAAVDLGASSGRVIHGRVGPGRLEFSEVRRFRNGPVTLPDGLYWDVLGLYQDILASLTDAVRLDGDITGIAIDSWAVDYGLVDSGGSLMANPRHYRDDRTAPVVDTVHTAVSPEKLYQINGVQYQPFNTLYQFAADQHVHHPGVQALLIPDLVGYWLTGRRVSEQTNASTTGLLDATTGHWSTKLIEALGLSTRLLPDLIAPGTVVGELSTPVRGQIGVDRPMTVTAVGSHDTASAVVGVPSANPRFGYISCGTWGLVGVELDHPVLTAESRAANFTNEHGVDGTIRYLANVMGLWLLAESVRTWQLHHRNVTLAELLRQAGEIPASGPRFDPDDPVFLPPGDMPARIADVLTSAGEQVPTTPAGIVRCILDSLAATFTMRINQAEQLSGQNVDIIHIVGGGSQNELLCQLTADAAGRPVVAGPVEATALGNLLVQARTHHVLSGDLWALRTQLRDAVTTRHYLARRTAAKLRIQL